MNQARAEATLCLRLGSHRSIVDGRLVRLLELIHDHGSIRHAATLLGMGYRTAWELISELNRVQGSPIVLVARGGAQNGSRLTGRGHALVRQFRHAEWVVSACLDQVNAEPPLAAHEVQSLA